MGDLFDGLDKITKLEEQLNNLVYKYIRVDFNSDGKVTEVFFDAEKCESKEYKKIASSFEVTNDKDEFYLFGIPIPFMKIQEYIDMYVFKEIRLEYKIKYSDKSLYKGIKRHTFISTGSQEVELQDRYGNKLSKTYNVLPSEYLDCWAIYSICDGDKTKLTEFIVPEGVIEIEDSTFAGFDNLISILIPSSVTSIGDGAFSGCSSLTSITFGENSQLTSIGERAFYDCSSLTSIVIPSSVTSIGAYAFYNCSRLTSIEIPSSVTSIGNYAFYECSSLMSVEIPSSVTSIGDWAFYNCSRLASIYIPSSVKSMGYRAFCECRNLDRIYCATNEEPSGWGVWIEKYSLLLDRLILWDCIEYGTSENGLMWCLIGSTNDITIVGCNEELEEVVIPNVINGHSVTSISDNAFYNCSSLTSIEIPSSVTSIGSYAFEGCSSLTSVEIPSSVTSIGYAAFSGCSGLTSIEIPSSVTSIGSYVFYNCSSLTSVEIPSSVTSIGYAAFSGCSGLTSIEIPSSVTSIGSYVFYNCSSLTIYCEAQSKPSGWDSRWNYSNRPVIWGYEIGNK